MLADNTHNREAVRACAVCGTENPRKIYSQESYSLFLCRSCRTIFLRTYLLPFAPAVNYNDNYFLEEYRSSYKRTYEEDRRAIYDFASRRLDFIQRLEKKSQRLTDGPAVLDIGAAMGFFLDAAAKRGYRTAGLEISSYAAGRCSKRHRVYNADFISFDIKELRRFEPGGFDLVTLWYVLEHFATPRAVIKKIKAVLKPGGLLAFSFPNGAGFSARFNRRDFLKSSPADHFFIYSLKSIRRLLFDYGFCYAGKRPSGIHYSRFQKRFPRAAVFVSKRIYEKAAFWFNLGDTMEVYFRRQK